MNFRRYYIPGTAVFITQVVQDREPVFTNPDNIALLRQILRNVKELRLFLVGMNQLMWSGASSSRL